LMQMYSQHLLHEYWVHSAHTPRGYTSQHSPGGGGGGGGGGRSISYTLYVRATPMGVAMGWYATPICEPSEANASKGAR
jgi:hypothetical protein